MENIDQAFGIVPIRHPSGEIRTNSIAPKYILKTGEIIRIHEPVIMNSDGLVLGGSGNDGGVYIGPSASYVDDSASVGGKEVLVYDDPNIVCKIQSVTGETPAQTIIGNCGNFTACTSTGRHSNSEYTTVGTGTANFLVVGKHDTPNNAFGEHCVLEVIAHEHLYKAAAAGGV